MENIKDNFNNEIFKIEAKSLLQDLMLNTILFQYYRNIDTEKINKIIDYIKNIFNEYHKLKQLHILTYCNDKTLYGYSLSFIHNKINGLYLHKIHVNEQYRNRGIGTSILKALQNENCKITLLCLKKKEKFYIKNGFHYVKPFPMLNYENYKLSRKIYNGLSLMSNNKEKNDISIFLLKDIDINNIANILKI